jgi:hypothetical protein
MPRATASRIRDRVNLLRDAPGLPFCDLLDAGMVAEALEREVVHFRERVYTPLVTLWTFLTQVLSTDHSCRAAVAGLIAHLAARGREPCSAETGSYCQARQRLPLRVITRLVRRTARDLDERAPEAWLWRGRHVALVDGTTVSMPDTQANQGAFPQSAAQAPGVGFPIARVVALVSLATGTLRDLAIGACKGKETGETALFRALWGGLESGEVVLGDRCFASYFGIAGLAARGVDGLFRMHRRRRYDFRRGTRLGIADHVVLWSKPQRPGWMDQASYELLPATLRIRELRIEVRIPGFRVGEVVLVTTLLDPLAYPKEDVASLYFSRWGIELDLRSIKVVMHMDVLRCETPEMVEKEVWMHGLAYNLIRGLMATAAEVHGKKPRAISFKGALQTLEAFRDILGLAPPGVRRTLLRVLIRTIASQRVGDRPGRVEPRAVKRRPKPHALLQEPRKEARKRLLKTA